MNSVTTIIRDAAKELNKFANYLDRELPTYEAKGFFLLRHLEAPEPLIPLQQNIIRDWEPRVSIILERLDARQYNKFRSWLGIDQMPSLGRDFEDLGAFHRFPHEEAAHLFRKRI